MDLILTAPEPTWDEILEIRQTYEDGESTVAMKAVALAIRIQFMNLKLNSRCKILFVHCEFIVESYYHTLTVLTNLLYFPVFHPVWAPGL